MSSRPHAIKWHCQSLTVRPPIILAYNSQAETERGGRYWVPVVSIKPILKNAFSSIAINPAYGRTPDEVLERLKALLKNDCVPKTFSIIAYFSKSIPQDLRSCPIHILEIYALLSFLHEHELTIQTAPLSIAFVDSRLLLFLLHPTTHRSEKKYARWAATITSRYPNLVLNHVKGACNFSDFLSRSFSIPKEETLRYSLSAIKFNKELDEILEKRQFLGWKELIHLARTRPELIEFSEKKLSSKAEKIGNFLEDGPTGGGEDVEMEINTVDTIPKILQLFEEALSPSRIATAQKAELSDFIENILANPDP